MAQINQINSNNRRNINKLKEAEDNHQDVNQHSGSCRGLPRLKSAFGRVIGLVLSTSGLDGGRQRPP